LETPKVPPTKVEGPTYGTAVSDIRQTFTPIGARYLAPAKIHILLIEDFPWGYRPNDDHT